MGRGLIPTPCWVHPTMILLTAPLLEPVAVADAKLAARLDGSHWDGIVAGAIAAAREVAEHETGQRFMQQTWRAELVDWPASTDLLPFLRPSAVAVSYWTGSAWAVLAGAAYVWAAQAMSIALAPALGSSWPALGAVALGPRVRVDVTLGATTAAAVAPAATQFIKALVTVMAADPSLTAMDALGSSAYLPRMLDPVRLYR